MWACGFLSVVFKNSAQGKTSKLVVLRFVVHLEQLHPSMPGWLGVSSECPLGVKVGKPRLAHFLIFISCTCLSNFKVDVYVTVNELQRFPD